MNYNQLSIDQAPSISTPLTFFITAPLFGLAAALLLFISGPESLQDRWLPSTLAITHLITLGFITMVMQGAMFQLLPVLAGVQIVSPVITSRIIFSFYSFGVVCLSAGLYNGSHSLTRIAVFSLAISFLIFLISTSYALMKSEVHGGSVKGMRFGIGALWIAVVLGLTLASGHSWESIPLLRNLTSLHIAWATLGWITILVISIAYQVIPMFQITANYPRILEKYLSLAIFLLLISWSSSQYLSNDPQFNAKWMELLSTLFISLLLVFFVGFTLRMQLQRRKRMVDTAFYFWLTGLINLCITLILHSYATLTRSDLDLLIAIIFFIGFAISVINGMLYKIVPFLVWLHLHRKLAFNTDNRSRIPTMNDVIPGRKSRLQLSLHILSLVMLVIAVLIPGPVLYFAALIWLINWILLWLNLAQSILLYKSCLTSK